MNNTELKQKQYTDNLEQEQLIGYWIKRYGITKQTLDTHPAADDIVALLRIREYLKAYRNHTTRSHDAKIGVMWQTVYKHGKPLKAKHYRTLENIVTDITTRAQAQQQKIQQARQTIQQARIKAQG